MHTEQVTLETPEHIKLHFELAGVGSRFLAAALDSLLQALIILALAFGLGYARGFYTADPNSSVITAIIVAISSMLIIIAYYMVFEMLWGGQSPGKRLAGLVVVRDDGSPITFVDSAIRNIMRVVDILLLFYTVGVISVLVTKKCKRLGDIAAGTIVVKVREYMPSVLSEPDEEIAQVPVPGPAVADPLVQRAMAHIPALTKQEIGTVTRFMERRLELEAESRRRLAERIRDGLSHKFPALQPAETPSAEVFLELIHQAYLLREQRPGDSYGDPAP